MFQFPRFPPAKRRVPRLFIEAGCPIRRSPAELARQLTEAYRSLATSFFGFQRLGIHRAPVVAWTTSPLPPQTRVGCLRCTLYSLVNVLPACRRTAPPKLAWTGESAAKESQSQRSRPDAGRPVICTRPLSIARLFDCQERPFRQDHPFPGGFGGAGGTRTPDFRLAKAALSQLSYGPTPSRCCGGRWWTRTTDLGLIRTAL